MHHPGLLRPQSGMVGRADHPHAAAAHGDRGLDQPLAHVVASGGDRQELVAAILTVAGHGEGHGPGLRPDRGIGDRDS